MRQRRSAAPHEAVELVGSRVVDRLGLERLALGALHGEREASSHRAQLTARDTKSAIAWIIVAARIADMTDHRAEQPRHLLDVFRHSVEVAHAVGFSGIFPWLAHFGSETRPKVHM